jgi:hypothetical protein
MRGDLRQAHVTVVPWNDRPKRFHDILLAAVSAEIGERFILKALLAMAFLASASTARAQSEDLISREIDGALEGSLWELGPFHLTPQLSLGVGHDSDVFTSANSPNPDVIARAAPGLQAVVPLRNRALLEIHEQLDLVQYRDLDELGGIFNATRAGGAAGFRNLMVRVENDFREERTPPSSELDVPVDQRTNFLTASLNFSLGWRDELSLEYRNFRVAIRDPELEVEGVPIQSLLDRLEDTYGMRFTRHLTNETAANFEFFYQVLDFDEDVRDSKAYGGVAGFAFSRTGNVRGGAQLGFKRIVSNVATQTEFAGLIGALDVQVGLGQRFALQGLYSRDAQPSVLADNSFSVANSYGALLSIYLGPRFFIRPGAVYDENTYPEPVSSVDSQGVPIEAPIIERSNTYSLTLNYHLTPTWLIGVGGHYSIRHSNSASPVEDRLLVSLELRMEL